MKNLLLLVLILSSYVGFAQQTTPKHSTYYEQRASHFEGLPTSKNDIIFLGNSITDGAEWAELFQNPFVKNRGISGDRTDGVYDRLEAITQGNPKKIFLLIGINDVAYGRDNETIVRQTQKIIRKIKADSPRTKIFLQSILPVNPCYGKFHGHTSQWMRIPQINKWLQQIAQEEQVTYIDLFSHFVDKDGQMQRQYTNDGLHLLGEGYKLWKTIIEKHVK